MPFEESSFMTFAFYRRDLHSQNYYSIARYWTTTVWMDAYYLYELQSER